MITLRGKYNEALVYQSEIDSTTRDQIETILDQPFVEGEDIRIMPDCHAGAGCVIGTTLTFRGGKVCPNLIGVDIGCGVSVVKLEGIKSSDVNFEKFDEYLRRRIPLGKEVNSARVMKFPSLTQLKCYKELSDVPRLERSLGTLGGGNHFIELDQDSQGGVYFLVHTGSRNLGKQVAEIYQRLADGTCNGRLDAYFLEKKSLIETYKKEGKTSLIQKALGDLKRDYESREPLVPKDLAWLEGQNLEDYLNDLGICQEFARLNREIICRTACQFFGRDYDSLGVFESVHNYIDLEGGIIRKGSIQALKGQRVIIPINMKDGSIIGRGKGNPEYNLSAPHGAGRIMSRGQARREVSLEDFKKSMEGIFTTSVCEETLDESSFAYKSLDSVLPWIEGTVEVEEIIKPLYNLKATD